MVIVDSLPATLTYRKSAEERGIGRVCRDPFVLQESSSRNGKAVTSKPHQKKYY
jgi:hypothetical protein